VSVCPPLITFEPTGRFSLNFVAGDVIQGDLDAVIYNTIASTILKWLIKFLRCALINSGLRLFMIVVGFPWQYKIKSLADVTMITKACNFYFWVSFVTHTMFRACKNGNRRCTLLNAVKLK
jgi:hypothetical protein